MFLPRKSSIATIWSCSNERGAGMTVADSASFVPAAGRHCASRVQRLRMIKATIVDSVGTDVAKVEQILDHSLGGGKAMRALLAHISADWCGLGRETCNEVAAAMEMIHVAALLHDDIVDDAASRRHHTSANFEFGSDAAVLAGDFLYSRASQLLCRTNSMALLAEIADATNLLAEGEVMQLANKGFNTDADAYFEVIRRKTAALFAACAVAGPLVVGAGAMARSLRVYGEQLGIAFQLTDDCLDYASSDERIGKPAGSDFGEGKMTRPLLVALELADASQQQCISHALANHEQAGSFDEVQKIIHATKALEQVADEAEQCVARAHAALNDLPACAHADMLKTLATRAVRRDH